MSLLIALVALVIAGRFILKKYNPQGVLFTTGIVLMVIAIFMQDASFVKKSTGFIGFDIFEYISATFSNRGGGLGLKIMLIGGFAMLMSAIGASQVMVRVAAKPLTKLRSPYLMLALAFILGQFLSLFISSATGLGLLLMATLYPVLVNLGCSRASVAAVLASTCAVEMGPGSGNSILAAKTAGLDITEYFVSDQLPITIPTILAIAVVHALTQRYFDNKSTEEVVETQEQAVKQDDTTAPLYYVLLPILPLFLMLTFSKIGVESIRVGMSTAIIISVAISLVCEFTRCRDSKVVFDKLQGVFSDMGKIFATVVTLIIAGQTFAMGLKSIGAIDAMIELATQFGFSAAIIVLIMALLTFSISALMGSGNAAFFSFAPTVPQIAKTIGVDVSSMILPIQMSAGMGRTISPIAGVIIAVSGMAGLSPFDVVRRTLLPMLSGWLFMLTITFSGSGQLLDILPFLAGMAVLASVVFFYRKNKEQKLATE
ncbi:C4-dicarboxylate transporter DcuC [Vibrio sp. HN007]|uniref:C4-dicarboxylate transporter DcuC n=1 Tax=Vibrio iocasae TaxID=3098914 RepID=UPI0035D4CB2E